MPTGHWRDEYERHADHEAEAVDTLPIRMLAERIQRGEYGDYYAIWRSLARRASLHEVGWTLFDVLQRPIDYLYRYHCASALLQLLNVQTLQPVHLSSGAPAAIVANLREVEKLLESRIGPHP